MASNARPKATDQNRISAFKNIHTSHTLYFEQIFGDLKEIDGDSSHSDVIGPLNGEYCS